MKAAGGAPLPASSLTMQSSDTSTRQKWGRALDYTGFQTVPNLLLAHQHQLELSNTDLVVLLHVNRFWWTRDQDPFPKPAHIAAQMGVHRRSVERCLKRLEQKGLIKRTEPRETPSGVVRPISLLPLADVLIRKADQLRIANQRSGSTRFARVRGDEPNPSGTSSKEASSSLSPQGGG